LVFIEAMATGTPVVAFAKGSVPEVIKDGQTGLLSILPTTTSGVLDHQKNRHRRSMRSCRADLFPAGRSVSSNAPKLPQAR